MRACMRMGFVFVPLFEIYFCLSVFYAWDYTRYSHYCELLPVAISYRIAMCNDGFRQTEVNCMVKGAEQKVSYVVGVW